MNLSSIPNNGHFLDKLSSQKAFATDCPDEKEYKWGGCKSKVNWICDLTNCDNED